MSMLCMGAYAANAQGTKTLQEGNQMVTRTYDSKGRITKEISTPVDIFRERGNKHIIKDPNAFSNLTASDGNLIVTETRNEKGQILNRDESQINIVEPKHESRVIEPKREPRVVEPKREPASEPRVTEPKSASDRHRDYLDRTMGGRAD